MFSEENFGLIGGIIGGLIGVAGGIFGTWMSIRGTSPGAQRKFMIKMSICAWIGVAVLLVAVFLIPGNWKWIIWVVYAPILTISIVYTNRKLSSLSEIPTEDS